MGSTFEILFAFDSSKKIMPNDQVSRCNRSVASNQSCSKIESYVYSK